LMFSKFTFLLFFPIVFLLLFSITFLLFQACVLAAPSSHSCCISRLCSYCSKLEFLLFFSIMFLLLQAHIQVLFFLIAFFYSSLCSCYSWVAFFLLLINIPWVAFFLLFINISFFLNLPCCFWFFNFFALGSNPLAIGLSRWLLFLWPPDVVTFQGYPLLLALLMLFFFQE
jgi:hypothetical protein